MVGEWTVRFLPRCTHHVFLSHCGEDRERLVKPLHAALENSDFSPWFDQHHYPAGQSAFEALREGILLCRHVVFLVTAPFRSQGRGWNSVEIAYSNLLQENLRLRSLELAHVQFPLFFLPPGRVTLRRSAWGPIVERGRFYPSGRVDAAAATWAVEQITAFIRQEERRGQSLAIQLQNDPGFRPLLAWEPNLLRRVMCADPLPIP